MKTPNMTSSILSALLATSVFTFPLIGQAAPSGSVNWNGWTFNYDVSGKYDGLSLMKVQFQNMPIIAKISFPVMQPKRSVMGGACVTLSRETP